MTANYCIGWDIGGAHLKVARVDADGTVVHAAQYATPLWRGLDVLDSLLARMGGDGDFAQARHALTMTGELVDLFPDRDTGVRRLLDLFLARFDAARTSVFAGARGLIAVPEAHGCTTSVASANWLATASCAARHVAHGVLVDVGSTTTDIVPIAGHVPCHRGSDDWRRLQCGELVYTGVVRTPVMALAQRVPFAGCWQNVAAELFATAADVHRIDGSLDEADDMQETPDLRGKSVGESIARLARMLGTEPAADDSDRVHWRTLARHLALRQLLLLDRAFQTVRARMGAGPVPVVIGAGAGAFMAQRLAARQGCPYVAFADLLPRRAVARRVVAACAPAVAVADLAVRSAGS